MYPIRLEIHWEKGVSVLLFSDFLAQLEALKKS